MSAKPEPIDRPQLAHHELLDLFEELTFREKWEKVLHGIRQPKDTGDYKFARLQLIRMSAPIAAVLTPVVAVGCMMIFGDVGGQKNAAVTVTVMEAETLKDLDETPPEIDDAPIPPPEPIEVDMANIPSLSDVPALTVPGNSSANVPESAKPASFDTVAIVKSPVVMKGIYASRTPGARGKALAEYGGALAGITEGAVLRALRWLKKNQAANGSWSPPEPMAMTGLGILTFLAHGETPESEEFGDTVQRAIRFLEERQSPDGHWASSYTHAIATYAMCEAYALTKIPMLKEKASKGIDVIIKGQNPAGGWNYPLVKEDAAKQRNDTSVMGWCAQALKAAHMAGLENEGLKACIRESVKGFQRNAAPSGGFGYCGPGAGGLTGVGVLCMQLLGAGKMPEVKNGLIYLDKNFAFDWDDKVGWNNVYYWYYITQCKFHAGGGVWNDWNRQFAPQLVKAQQILRGEGIDGKDIGFWKAGEKTQGVVMDTTLCTLMLEVYYRYLPTYKPPAEMKLDDGEKADKDDIEVKVTI
jgi:hypothetical protein